MESQPIPQVVPPPGTRQNLVKAMIAKKRNAAQRARTRAERLDAEAAWLESDLRYRPPGAES